MQKLVFFIDLQPEIDITHERNLPMVGGSKIKTNWRELWQFAHF